MEIKKSRWENYMDDREIVIQAPHPPPPPPQKKKQNKEIFQIFKKKKNKEKRVKREQTWYSLKDRFSS